MPSLRSHLIKPILRHLLRKEDTSPLPRLRAAMDRNAQRCKCAAGVVCQTVEVEGRPAEWLIPLQVTPDAAMLYLHGGAYRMGSIDSHRALVTHIAAASRMPVLLLDYRLAPEHPFPAALDDATAAFLWITTTMNIAANRIVVSGDSAGGGLSLATTLRLRDKGNAVPGALVLLSPWTDLTLSGSSVERLKGKDLFFPTTQALQEAAIAYASTTPLNNAEVSPRFADLRGLPSIYIQVGSEEMLLSDSLDLACAAKSAGVNVQLEQWSGMWHVWQGLHGWMPEADDAIRNVGDYVQANFSASRTSRER